jgi:protein TonB
VFDKPWVKRVAIGLIGLLVLAAIGLVVKSLMKGGKARKPNATVIAVLRPPPPPPPPKPEDKPPPPEMKKEEVKLDEPKPDDPKPADEPPVSQDLKMDGPAGAGDGFGIQAGKGRDITTIGGGGTGGTGTGGRAQFAFFTNVLQQRLQEDLMANKKLRSADYRAVLRIWLRDDGRVERVELAGSTGNAEIDSTIRTVVAESAAARQSPPAGMPQPVKIEVTSRGAG